MQTTCSVTAPSAAMMTSTATKATTGGNPQLRASERNIKPPNIANEPCAKLRMRVDMLTRLKPSPIKA